MKVHVLTKTIRGYEPDLYGGYAEEVSTIVIGVYKTRAEAQEVANTLDGSCKISLSHLDMDGGEEEKETGKN